MLALHPEYVVNERRETKAVLLPFDEWQQILEAIEELDEIEMYDKAKEAPGEYIPFEEAVREIQTGEAS